MVCGSRTWKDKELLFKTLDDIFFQDCWTYALGGTERSFYIVHGGASGADTLASLWFLDNKFKYGAYQKEIVLRPVDNKKISYLYRNVEMITMAHKIVAFWDGESRGTKFVIDYAKARGKNIVVIQEKLCKVCGHRVSIRNPSGKCDHLYYPENVAKNFE